MRRTRRLEAIEGAEVAGLWGSAPRDGRSMDLTALDRLGLDEETPRGWSTEHVAVRDAGCTSGFGALMSTHTVEIVAGLLPLGLRAGMDDP